MFRKLSYIGIGLLVAVPFGAYALSVSLPEQGGTGTNTVPSYGQVLVGDGNGVYQPVATSTLNITASAVPNVTYTSSSGTNYYQASSTPTDNLSWFFKNGFVSNASSTVNSNFTANYASSTALTVSGDSYLSGTSGVAISSVGTGNGTIGFNSYSGGYIAGATGYGGLLQFTIADGKLNYFSESSVTAGSAHGHTTAFTVDPAGFFGISSTSPGSILSIGTSPNQVANFQTGTSTIYGNLKVNGNIEAGGAVIADVNLVSSGDATISGALTVIGNTTINSLTSGRVTYAGASGLLSDSSSFLFDSSLAKLTVTNASTTAFSIGNNLYLPGSTNPSFTLSGTQFDINTNTASTSLRAEIGGSEFNLPFDKVAGLPFASSTLAYNGSYGTTGTTTTLLANSLRPLKLIGYYCKTDTGTAYVNFNDGTNLTTTVQCTSSGAYSGTLSTNNTWTQFEDFKISIGTEASNPNVITVTPYVQQQPD